MAPSRTIPDPGFSGDDGRPDAGLVAALEQYARDRASGYLPALAALCSARLLVPVLAQGEESDDVDMATVLMRRPDGATALLSFSGTAALAAWDPAARPIPATAVTAATAAVQEGAVALLVDHAGPVQLAVEGDDLVRVAQGWWPVPLEDGGWGWATSAE